MTAIGIPVFPNCSTVSSYIYFTCGPSKIQSGVSFSIISSSLLCEKAATLIGKLCALATLCILLANILVDIPALQNK